MTTCRDLIKTALRKCAVIGSGRDPGPSQASDGLAALQSMYDEWVNGGAFGRLTDYVATGNYTAAEQDRVLNTSYVITIPTSITDAITGEARPPYDLSMIQVVKAATAPQVSVYDSVLAGWVRLDALALGTTAPLVGRGLDGLASCLARKLTEEYGGELGPLSLASAARFESALSRRVSSPERPVEYGYF